MRSVLSFFVILFVAQFGFAKANFDGLTDSTLKTVVASEAARNHHAIGYSQARKEMFGRIDLEQSGGKYFVHDKYCDIDISGSGVGPGKIPNNTQLNTEHTWPQSRFGGRDRGFQKSDMHHLFPTDSEMNGTRGSNPFGEVTMPDKVLKCPASASGRNATGTRVFEPPMNHRGNVARALFYFSVRYGMKIDPTQESVLKKWNQQDPVDDEELDRNNEIEKSQGNRNPFIDSPELADRVSDF